MNEKEFDDAIAKRFNAIVNLGSEYSAGVDVIVFLIDHTRSK